MIPTNFHLNGSTQDYKPASSVNLIYTTITFYGLAFQPSSTTNKIFDLLCSILVLQRLYPTTLPSVYRQNG